MYWALLSIDGISIWQVLINGVISIQDSQVSAAQVLCNKVAVYLLHQQAGASTSTYAGASTSTCCSVLSTECQYDVVVHVMTIGILTKSELYYIDNLFGIKEIKNLTDSHYVDFIDNSLIN